MSDAAQPYPRVLEDRGDRGGRGVRGDREDREVTDIKDELRTLIRAAREQKSARQREEASAALTTVIADLPGIDTARCVAVYAARQSEPDTTGILRLLSDRGVEVLLPVLGSGLSRGWATYVGQEDLVQRAPGRPPEPSTPALGAEELSRADLVITPALAVDTWGARLGQGGGWYDRALQHARPGVPVVAVVFPEEVYDATTRPLPQEAHDRPVDLVATTERWFRLAG